MRMTYYSWLQLRNAIVHDRIAESILLSLEPNDWATERIQRIEQELIRPETVLPRFAKHVTGFEWDIPLPSLLETVAQKRYSQFPLYHKRNIQRISDVADVRFLVSQRKSSWCDPIFKGK